MLRAAHDRRAVGLRGVRRGHGSRRAPLRLHDAILGPSAEPDARLVALADAVAERDARFAAHRSSRRDMLMLATGITESGWQHVLAVWCNDSDEMFVIEEHVISSSNGQVMLADHGRVEGLPAAVDAVARLLDQVHRDLRPLWQRTPS